MILSIILLCLGFCASSMSNSYDLEQKQIVSDSHPSEKYIMYQGTNYVASQLDYCGATFLDNVFNDYHWLYNSAVGYYVDIPITSYVVYYNELNLNRPYPYYQNSYGTVNYLRVIHHANGSFGYGINYQTFTFNWCENANNILISYNVDCIFGAGYNFIGYSSDITSVVMNQYYLVFNRYTNSLLYTYLNTQINMADYDDGYNDGYQVGYTDGLNDNDFNPEMLTIFTGILDIALLPVNMFLSIFNFEVFGINIAGFISSLLTISIVVIIIRFLFGGKNNG